MVESCGRRRRLAPRGRVAVLREPNTLKEYSLSQIRDAGIMWGFPKIRGTFLGVPIIRTIVFWDLYWGPLILGNYHVEYIH